MLEKNNTPLSNILPCPFCGNHPTYKEYGSGYGDEPHNISCNNHHYCMVTPSAWGRSKYMAKKYWNTRA